MKKLTMICAAAAVVWSVSASARVFEAHDRWMSYNQGDKSTVVGAPEPATLGLLALGLGGLGLARRRRK